MILQQQVTKVHVVHDQSYPVNQLLPQAIGSVLQQSIAEQLGVVWHTASKASCIEAIGERARSSVG